MRHVSLPLAAGAALCSLAASVAAAQPQPSPVTLPAGVRVRVTAPDLFPTRQAGLLLRDGPDSLVLIRSDDRTRLAMPRTAITSLDVSAGRPRKRPALIGAGIGVIGGVVVGGTVGKREDPSGFGGLLGLVAGAVVGQSAGALIGAAVAPERWDRRGRPGPAPAGPASVVFVPAAAPSTASLALPIGREVRLWDRLGRERARGHVSALSADSLVLMERGARTAYAWDDLERLALQQGRDRWRGFRRGVLMLGLFTAAVAAPISGKTDSAPVHTSPP